MTPERKRELRSFYVIASNGHLNKKAYEVVPTDLCVAAIPELLDEIERLEAGLREALDEISEAWSNVEDYPRNKHEDVALAQRLRALIGGGR